MKTIENTPLGIFEVHWGVLDNREIDERYGSFGGFRNDGRSFTFQDPIYPDERKTLAVYRHVKDPDCLVLMAEITPGVYANGFQTDGKVK